MRVPVTHSFEPGIDPLLQARDYTSPEPSRQAARIALAGGTDHRHRRTENTMKLLLFSAAMLLLSLGLAPLLELSVR
jgi:hypothetical protein